MIKLRTILLRSSRGSLHSPGSILIRNQEISVNSTVEGCSHSLYTVGFAPAANERLEFMKKEPGSPVHFSRFPLPGQRILRSVISVWLCIVVYYLRGRRGEPFYSIIAALQCIQPYSSSMLSEGRDRIIGTFIGAFWGAAIVFSELLPIGGSFETALIHYSLLGLLTGLVIYSTVLLKIPQYALFSAMVFLGISMYHLEDANPYIHVFNRTMDTIIGVVIAIDIQLSSSTAFWMTGCALPSPPNRHRPRSGNSSPKSISAFPSSLWTGLFCTISIPCDISGLSK